MTCRSRPRPAPAIAWVVLCGMLVVLGARVVASLYQDPSDPFVDAGTIPTRSVHPKIDVNGNAQLAMIVDRGSGTESDPYIIENRIINAGGIDSAIYIRHTTAHLVIKNCTLSNAGDGIDIGPAGLFLQNVQNVRITGCRVHNNQQAGILIYVSQDVTVEASNVTGNMFGVQVTRSNHTLVTKCTVTSNSYGILPQGSRHTTITWNTVSGNYYGALLVQSNNSHVVRNQFNNTINAGDYHGYDNTWNDGARGNYWADYEILYPHASHNQIYWNTPYNPVVRWTILDNRPLVNVPSMDVPGRVTGVVTTRGKDHVNISWSAPASQDVDYWVTGYVVYWSLDNLSFTAIPLGNVTFYQHLPLDYRQAYYYRVAAVNPIGEGDGSAVVVIVPGFEVVMFWVTNNVLLVAAGGIIVVLIAINVKLLKKASPGKARRRK